jgi:hypothetical protein
VATHTGLIPGTRNNDTPARAANRRPDMKSV